MADYVYLLQNRLTPAQQNALGAVRDAARSHGMTVFLVGGAARDLTSGTPVRDLDLAVQGEVGPLVEDLKAQGASVSGENPVLSSVYLLFPGGVRTELGPTLTVTFPKPGQPETQPAAILDDLRRRDFTANAMAISLNEGSYGLLLDPLNGVADLENRELRLVSNYGFIEQPSLLLRAARLSERLGWSLEERTQRRYETAKEENYIQAITERERGYELEEIFHEEDSLAILDHLGEEGWGDVLYPAWSSAKADREGLERLRDTIGQMDQMGIHVDPAPAFFPPLTAKLNPAELAGLKQLFVRPGFVQQIESLEARSKELAAQMTSKAAAAPSDTWKLLFSSEPEIVLWLAYSSRSNAVQSKFKAFLNEWPQMRQRIPYALMQEMRITPDLPGYNQLLEDLFFALIDGRLDSPEATRAFLEPFSPPAPVVQAPPRRRPAKAARSRSKKAAAPAAVAQTEPEETSGSTAAPTVEGAEPEDAAVSSPPPAAKKAVAPARPTAGVAVAANEAPQPVKSAGVKSPAKAAAKSTPAIKQAPTPAAKTPAKASLKGVNAAAHLAPKPSPAKKTAAKAVPPKKAVSSKLANVKAAPAAKQVKQPATKASATVAKSTGASKGKPAVAPKKTAPAKKSPPTPAKKSAPAKKPAKNASKHKR